MKRNDGKLLVIEDDAQFASEIIHVLSREGFHALHTCDGTQGLAQVLSDSSIHVLLTDFELPGTGGMAILERVRAARTSVPVIFMARHRSTKLAIEATKNGAFDYLLKPFGMDALIPVVRQAFRTARLNRRTVHLREDDQTQEGEFMIGSAPAMQQISKEVGRLADRNVPVLITGETGSGKELIAQALWQFSSRVGKPFIAVNCAAIPAPLLESEFFGHEKGAFTGAASRRIGRFEQATTGTLFLDEIGDIPLDLQAKLLRVIQEKSIQRLGSTTSIPVDVRIVAATNRDLRQLCTEGKYREDLFYRLNATSLHLPPLRERMADIPPLVTFFLNRYAAEFRISVPAVEIGVMDLLRAFPWPGNVRQLQNVIRSALIGARGFAIEKQLIRSLLEREATQSAHLRCSEDTSFKPWADMMLDRCKKRISTMEEEETTLGTALSEIERYLLKGALQRCGNNHTAAAQLLGVSRATLLRRLKDYRIS